MRGATLALAMLLLLAPALASPLAAASVTRSCQLTPHGFLVSGNTDGCTVSGVATTEIRAEVRFIAGTVDEIEIDMRSSGNRVHVFVCTVAIAVSACVLPVQQAVVPGTWFVTARIVAADPLGPFDPAGVDTWSELVVTFT